MQIEKVAKKKKVRASNVKNSNLPMNYPTLNLLHYLHQGENILSVGICQTAEAHNFLDFGQVLGEAVQKTDGRVALLAAGGLSHRFWPMDDLPSHFSWDPKNIHTPEARAMDEKILSLWQDGNHSAVIDLYPDYRPFAPEGFFGHYLMMVGAIGGRACTAPGRLMSEYENAAGTGQVHMWFELG